jgi:predicted glycosyltransferase
VTRVLFYVQHLLGIGHLARASLIADALHAQGAEVTMVTGGEPVPGLPGKHVRIIQLPSLRAGPEGFSQLVDADGKPADAAYRSERTSRLLAALEDVCPDVLLIEAFPFGRRQMRFELLPLLDAASARRPKPLIACSVRDVLQHRAMKRHRETVDVINRYFDRVLVHGDPDFITLEETFPLADAIAGKLSYTGIVSAAPGALAGPAYEVIVSAGGGVAAAHMMNCALEARTRTSLAAASWCFLVGPNHHAESAKALAAAAGHGIHVEPVRPDFRALLQRARLSISQAGYNTVADILRAGCRSVLVPFAQGGESEQTLRAGKLQALGRVGVVAENDLTAQALAAVIDEVIDMPAPAQIGSIDTGGAECSASILLAG